MHRTLRQSGGLALVGGFLIALPAASGFDPASGVWTKDDPSHLRVLTYNVYDGIGVGVDTTPASSNALGSQYDYIGRICAALAPDVICFQEVTVEQEGSSAQTLAAVESWASAYFGAGVFEAYVSSATDGFNRNVILSRHPFADLNGDGAATAHDVFVLPGAGGLPPGTPPGGHLRGWAQVEIDLPDDVYLGDLFVGNSHLKCCSGGMAERLEATQNIAWWVNEALNDAPAPFGPPDPLDANTPVILCGDFNEDEDFNGRYGPVSWLAGWTTAADDGTDRDGSEMLIDTAVEPFSGDRRTFRDSSSKLDYVLVQDAIAQVVNEFVFQSDDADNAGALPAPLQGIYWSFLASSLASDHYPVIVDLSLPLVKPGDFDRDGDVDGGDYTLMAPCLLGPGVDTTGACLEMDLDEDGHVDLHDFRMFQQVFGS